MTTVRTGTAQVTVQPGGTDGGTWVNVLNFGAVGNDIHDDGPAIADAIASLPAGGGTVFFPPGTYKVVDPILITQNNVWLVGSGATIDNQNTLAQPAIIMGTGMSFVLGLGIQRLNITGNPASGSGIVLNLVSDVLIQDVDIFAIGGHGIEAPGEVLATTFERVTITGMTVNKNAWHFSTNVQCNVLRWVACVSGGNSGSSNGVYVVPFIGGVHVDWVFESCAFQACQHGIWLNNVFGVQITGQYFEANSAGDIRLGTLGNPASGVRVTSVQTAVANGSGLGGYFLRLEEGARLLVLGLVSIGHAETFSVVSPNEGGETFVLSNFEISADALMYGAGTVEGTGFPGPIKGVLGISGDTSGIVETPRNLRGTAVIANPSSTSVVVLPNAEIDNAYYVTAIVSATTGVPAAGATRVFITNKIAAGFTINLEAAPGVGATVTVDWIMMR
jgi:hypothetical protein